MLHDNHVRNRLLINIKFKVFKLAVKRKIPNSRHDLFMFYKVNGAIPKSVAQCFISATIQYFRTLMWLIMFSLII